MSRPGPQAVPARLHRLRRALLALALPALVAAAAGVASSPTFAQDDPRKEARLLYLEGKFREAESILDKAGADVTSDKELRAQLAEIAKKALAKKTGEERRAGLEALVRCYTKITEAGDPQGLEGAATAGRELADLDLAARKPEDALSRAKAILALAEKADLTKAGPEGKVAVGEAYAIRARATKKPDRVDAVVADFQAGAKLLLEAAAGHEKEGIWTARAASIRAEEATFVHDTIPLPAERRDEDALLAAIQLAQKACAMKGAVDATYDTHLLLLRKATEWEMKEVTSIPPMKPLMPAVEGLAVQIPQGSFWKRVGSNDWTLHLERRFEGETNSVQLLVKFWGANEAYGGRKWSQVEEVTALRFEAAHGDYAEVASEQKPQRVGTSKKGPGTWMFQIGGMIAGNRPQKRVEWYVPAKDGTWQVKLIDWRRPSSVDDPDLRAIVASIVGATEPADDGKDAKDDKSKKPPTKKK
jgi:hypothetical protein